MKNIIIVIVIALLVVAGALIFSGKKADAPAESTTQNQNTACEDQTTSGQVTISYTSGKQFSPSCVRVKAGSKLTWQNDSNATLAIGANPHPTHTGNQEVSGGAFTLDVSPSSSKSVTLNTTGSHGYHDHNNSSSTGTIIVE